MVDDERFAWNAATTVASILTLISIVSRILAWAGIVSNPLDPFTLEFSATILYLPTSVLLVVASRNVIWRRLLSTPTSQAPDTVVAHS